MGEVGNSLPSNSIGHPGNTLPFLIARDSMKWTYVDAIIELAFLLFEVGLMGAVRIIGVA
tara:strand:+ start:872 stop:1051 length:180 start_codon:yes stop_codon:yes gene_type:complete